MADPCHPSAVVIPSAATQWDILFQLKEDFDDAYTGDAEAYRAALDALGADKILDFVSHGRLPVELALANRIPPMVLQEWIEDNITPEQMERAKRNCAEVCVLKSTLCLTASPETPQDGVQQRALAEQYAGIAEKMDPERWGPPRKAEPPPPSVVLNFNIPTPEQMIAVYGDRAKDVTPPHLELEYEDVR